MTDRRSFLKGLTAAFVVPSPTLWTPKERELVAATELPPPPEPPSRPQVESGFDAGSRAGYLMAVMPSYNASGGWFACYTTPHQVTIDSEVVDHYADLPFDLATRPYYSYPTVSEFSMSFKTSEIAMAEGETSHQAVRRAMSAVA